MEKVKGKILRLKGNTNYAYIIAGGTVIVLLCVIILLNLNRVEEQYIIQNDDIENTEIATAYVIKDEEVIEKDTNKVLLPVVAEAERVSKNSIIATYKGTEYDTYLTTLEDLDNLKELATTIKNTSLCGLGKCAPNPILSTLNNFYDEYLSHVVDKKCPAGKCQSLLNYIITDACKGCTKCARVCPAKWITGKPKEKHEIDTSKCLKCGACMDNCKFNAIIKK